MCSAGASPSNLPPIACALWGFRVPDGVPPFGPPITLQCLVQLRYACICPWQRCSFINRGHVSLQHFFNDNDFQRLGVTDTPDVIVALGKFDALHRGHRSLVERAAQMGGHPYMLSFRAGWHVCGGGDHGGGGGSTGFCGCGRGCDGGDGGGGCGGSDGMSGSSRFVKAERRMLHRDTCCAMRRLIRRKVGRTCCEISKCGPRAGRGRCRATGWRASGRMAWALTRVGLPRAAEAQELSTQAAL
eukprot:361767-Chlamydomonas_euryale.AAC.6